ncbi:uncharacterized protein TNIN_262641 [Trichonephila inaurata madagascariensis]|uniref:Uncharacterized protein n=1 Tax=Trichonephila inaurata madagascariensis TaxID=2747483 RepID=A0A8X7BU21_9ARAC|nr:uncharacterized protein TNIN_262641 [Trichonephila inaurata madagascariensis]
MMINDTSTAKDLFIITTHVFIQDCTLTVLNDPDVRHFTSTHDIHNCIWSSEEIESVLGKEPARLIIMAETRSHKSYKLLQDHKTIFKSTTKLLSRFHWTQDNKIDRYKTAKAIIADDNIDIRERFLLASHYCFQEDVISIWEILDDAQKNFFQKCDFNIEQKWVNWAGYGRDIDWEEIALVSRFGVQRYFPKLEREERLRHLKCYKRGIWNDYHELQFCLSILDQNEQKEILEKCPFQILQVFLDWPIHEKLLDVVELLWPYLTEQNFLHILYLILYQKRLFYWIGYDYVTIVIKLWKRVSFPYSILRREIQII